MDAVSLSSLLHDGGIRKKAEDTFNALERIDKSFKGITNRGLLDFEEQDGDYKKLFRDAAAPWGKAVVNIHGQALHCDGWSGDERLWRIFEQNAMKSRQDLIINETLTFGYTYVAVLPADTEGDATAVIIPMSAKNTYAEYESPWDDHPKFVLQRHSKDRWTYIDDEAVYEIQGELSSIKYMTVLEHNLGICPAVRIDEQPADKLSYPVPPFTGAITTAQSITETRFHQAMVGRHASYPRLWGTGISLEPGQKVDMAQDTIFATDSPEAKLGAFPQADASGITGILNSYLAQLAILTNTPLHLLNGDASVANLSAEALASLQFQYERGAERRKASIGQGLDDLMRLIGRITNIEVADSDTVHWDILMSYSLTQVGDFIVKMNSIGLPLEPLLQMIPGYNEKLAKDSAKWVLDHKSATDAVAVVSAIEKKADTAKKLIDLGVSPEDAFKEVQLNLSVDSDKSAEILPAKTEENTE